VCVHCLTNTQGVLLGRVSFRPASVALGRDAVGRWPHSTLQRTLCGPGNAFRERFVLVVSLTGVNLL